MKNFHFFPFFDILKCFFKLYFIFPQSHGIFKFTSMMASLNLHQMLQNKDSFLICIYFEKSNLKNKN